MTRFKCRLLSFAEAFSGALTLLPGRIVSGSGDAALLRGIERIDGSFELDWDLELIATPVGSAGGKVKLWVNG